MSLNDQDVLRLHALCDALLEGTIVESERAGLEAWLARDEEARRYYVKAMDLAASLGRYAGEMQMGPADDLRQWAPRQEKTYHKNWIVNWGRFAVAASLLIAATAWFFSRPTLSPEANRPLGQGRASKAEPAAAPIEFVARITGAKESVWVDQAASFQPGTFLHRGQRLELAGGFAEVTFDSGAVLLLKGPATLDVNSAWDSTLRRGTLTATVPPQAIGFRVANHAVEVVDLGTEFSMVASGDGTAEVFVLKGEVEAMPRGPDAETMLLKTNESRRFSRSNVSGSDNPEVMFKELSEPVPLERPASAFGYLSWTFEQSHGRSFAAEAAGVAYPAETANLRLQATSPRARDDAHVQGFRGRALEFDGNLVARAKAPGLSGSKPRTIAFWMKTPENAQLSNAYSMVAWRADSHKLGSRPVHVGWNRNPAEGPLGAVRTDFSGGHAMGTTPLRDGKWHHIAVIFLPGDDSDAPVQVKQYVDGRLESNTVTPGEKRSLAAKIKVDSNADSADWLWLGCRLGANGPRKERFRGDIDELVVVDRSLEPGEVVQLMDGVLPAMTPK
jgi:hypothetical protein